MITNGIKQECIKLLLMLETNDILALKDTITNKAIATTTLEEAMDVIVTYSTSAEELLRRQKIKRDILFQYAVKQGITGLTALCTKPELVIRISQWWSGKNSREKNENNMHDDTGQVLAKDFIHWYYPILNNLAKDPFQSSSEWQPSHFWPDASVGVTFIRSEEIESKKFTGSQLACERLAHVVTQGQIVLNVNDHHEGYRGALSAHGLAKVAACGTIHQLAGTEQGPGPFVGIFEQMFGLLRDPSDQNRWKIKYTELKMKLTNVQMQTKKIHLSETLLKAICDE